MFWRVFCDWGMMSTKIKLTALEFFVMITLMKTNIIFVRACHFTVGWMTLKLTSHDMIMCHSVNLVLISYINLPPLLMN